MRLLLLGALFATSAAGLLDDFLQPKYVGGFKRDERIYYSGPTLGGFDTRTAGSLPSDTLKYHAMKRTHKSSLSFDGPLSMLVPLLVLVPGLEMTVHGPSEHGNSHLAVRAPSHLNAILDVRIEHLTREKPPPPDMRWLVAGLFAFMFAVSAICIFLIWCMDIEEIAEGLENGVADTSRNRLNMGVGMGRVDQVDLMGGTTGMLTGVADPMRLAVSSLYPKPAFPSETSPSTPISRFDDMEVGMAMRTPVETKKAQ